MRISDILSLLKEYIILGIIALIFIFIIFFIGYKLIYKKILKGEKNINKRKMILYGISIIYIIIVLGAVFLNRSNLYGYANLHLFSSYKEAYNNMQISLFRNIILNILLFIPLGFLLPFYSDKLKKGYKIILIGFIFTLIIEIIQYITKIGIFEIDDILNNIIGTLIGYCIFKIYYNLKNKSKKYIGYYFLPLIILILFFTGIYFKYQNQEFGNLSFNYNYKINMKNVDIENKIDFDNEKINKDIYYKKILTENDTRKIAENIFEKLNTKIDENEIDIYEDDILYWSEGRKYSVWVDYMGGTYSYTDYSMFDKDKAEETDVTKEKIENALKKLEINLPENAEFSNQSKGYTFKINMEIKENNLINGTLSCVYYNDDTIKKLENNIVKYEKINTKEIISEEEAYNEILLGKFKYAENYLGKIKKLEINNININYELDTKGYYVPVYIFDVKINEEETKIQIPALKG